MKVAAMRQSIDRMEVSRAQISRAAHEARLAGRPLCIHSSLRSFGHVEGGAAAIVDGLLDAGCTVMVMSSSSRMSVPAPPGLDPARNATPRRPPEQHDHVFTPESNEVDAELGVIVREVVERQGRSRGNHPSGSFTAIGPAAEPLVRGQRPLDVYAPLAELVRREGSVVLMGVGLNRMTLLHLAEKRAGRNLFRRWANGPGGRPVMVESGSCSEGFPNLEPQLRNLRTEVDVGSSRWQIYPARATLEWATHAIRRDPRITHCGRECPRCDDAVAGGPIL